MRALRARSNSWRSSGTRAVREASGVVAQPLRVAHGDEEQVQRPGFDGAGLKAGVHASGGGRAS